MGIINAKRILFIITIFIFCTGWYCVTYTLPDNDLWARLIAGSNILENLEVIKHDFLSYTPTHSWYDHEWGASVIFYFVLKYFGMQGLMILKGILVSLTFFFCFKTIEIREPKSSVPYNILYYMFLFCVSWTLFGSLIRCLIFTCLFFSIFVYILEYYRKKGGKCLLWLPFIMLLWVNIHGGCISAFGLFALYISGEFLNKKPVKPYIYTLLACVPVLFINPYGIEYVKFLFFAGLMDRTYISEWRSPFSHAFLNQYMSYKYYLLFVYATLLVYLRMNKTDYKTLDKTKLLLILATTYLSLTHIRHITFFMFTVSVFIYDEFYYLCNYFFNKFEILNKFVSVSKDITVYSLLLIIGFSNLLNENKEMRLTEAGYPYHAIEFVKINKIKGNLFIDFDWGSYAAYKLYPNNLIVMDGRYEEVYYPDLIEQMRNFHLVKGDWYKIIRDYKTDVMILSSKYPVYSLIENSAEWVKLFATEYYGVFVPVEKLKKDYLLPSQDNNYYNKTMFKSDIDSIKILY